MRFTSIVLLWLPFAAAASINSSSNLTGTKATESQLASISFRLYTGETIDEYTSVLIGNAVDLLTKIDPKKPTVFYIFGWTESPNSTSVEAIVGAYLKRQDHNIILINWEEIAGESYPIAAASAGSVGSAIAKALNELVSSGLDSKSLHIVSHSLGSHIAGFVGRNTDFKLPRITGLDPAGPGFYIVIDELTSADADFVDVIHTDAGIFGTTLTKATVNFHPNGGSRLQPGCSAIRVPFSQSDFCDHHRSWDYYAESLLNEDAFIGVECSYYIAFQLGLCSSNAKVVMGYVTPSTSSGNVYLQTNSESPYGRGEESENYYA